MLPVVFESWTLLHLIKGFLCTLVHIVAFSSMFRVQYPNTSSKELSLKLINLV